MTVTADLILFAGFHIVSMTFNETVRYGLTCSGQDDVGASVGK